MDPNSFQNHKNVYASECNGGGLDSGSGSSDDGHNMPLAIDRSCSAPPSDTLLKPDGFNFGANNIGSAANNNSDNRDNASQRHVDGADYRTPEYKHSGDDPRSDPNYGAYHLKMSRLDPRLPPPFYSPGQSWQQLWPVNLSSSLAAASIRHQHGEEKEHISTNNSKPSLVDRIQADFPRTPSPVYSHLRTPGSVSANVNTANAKINARPPSAATDESVNSAGRKAVPTAAAFSPLAHKRTEGNNSHAQQNPQHHSHNNNSSDPRNVRGSLLMMNKLSLGGGKSGISSAPAGVTSSVGASSILDHRPLLFTGIEPTTRSPIAPFATVNNSAAASINNTSNGINNYPSQYTANLLEEFKMQQRSSAPTSSRPATGAENANNALNISALQGHIVEFSCDQHGSRHIQHLLEQASPVERQQLFLEIHPFAHRLMTDVFGNYVIQKFFEHGNNAQKEGLVECMRGRVLSLSLQMYGCRVVQKALENLSLPTQCAITSELSHSIIKCVKDQNGNHVIQKCIEVLPSRHHAFIIDSFCGHLYGLATHPYGCRVIQRIFEHSALHKGKDKGNDCVGDGEAEDEKNTLNTLLSELYQHTNALIQDQYGNYVIQHIIQHGHPASRHKIISQIQGNILAYSRHKFASNVVEKCICYGGGVNVRRELIAEVLLTKSASGRAAGAPDNGNGTDDAELPLLAMMRDQYANYVVQKILDVVEGTQRQQLLAMVKPHLQALRKFPYAKHILIKVEKMMVTANT